MTNHTTRDLLEQALKALDNSIDVVYEEYTEAVQRYANIPCRKASLDRLAARAKAHLDTYEAIHAELAKPTNADPECTESSVDYWQQRGYLGSPGEWREACRLFRVRCSPEDIQRMAKLRAYIEDGLLIVSRPDNKPPTPAQHDSPASQCWCEKCRPIVRSDMRMVLCPVCGNKRCPKATDHRNACTGSNEPGQPGSSYPAIAPTPAWHDEPTEPGIWLCDEGGPDCYTYTAHNIVLLNDPALKDDECRWYGPIPQDGAKAEGGAA